MTSQFSAGDQVRMLAGVDRRVHSERGSIGIVTRAWRDPSGVARIDVTFPGGATNPGDDPARYELA